jgi:putative radical SAM enzyme (TIGR03279 family)
MSPRGSYGGRVPAAVGGGVVAAVEADGPAAARGVVAGDVIVAVEGQPPRDILDWQWLTDGQEITVAIRHAETTRTEKLRRNAGQSWGLHFADAVFDGVRTCENRCVFCFMAQLPKGLRRALYLRDDDFRLSFLQGNFVTLTNLSDADVARIAEQHLSPLYVSLHAIDPAVRGELVCAREDRALERFDELLGAGIDIHVQVVLVPGVNDGVVLDETLAWLSERECVLSVGIVPLGFTAHQERFSASYDGRAAAEVISQIEPWQMAFRERDAVTWVYLADEFYLKAGRSVPPTAQYDGYPQYENGIGIVRSFADEAAALSDRLASARACLPAGLRVALVTGELAEPELRSFLGIPAGPEAHFGLSVLVVPNTFFGGNVSVTGLLTAADIVPAIVSSSADVFLVPDIVVNADGLLLDDVAASELLVRTGRDVRLISCDADGLLAALDDLASHPSPTQEE